MSFLKNIFGGSQVKAPPIQYTPTGFSGGGLNAGFDGNSYNVSADPSRTGVVGDISSNFRNFGDITGGLRDTVAPGFNDLLRSRLNTFNDSATSAIGDLRQNLQARRVLGSSFGQDTISRADAEFGRQRDAIVSDNFLKSLQANNDLLKQQYDAYNQDFQSKLGELNLEAGIANGLTGKAADILGQNARTSATLAEDASKANNTANIGLASGLGSLAGRVAFAPFTGGASLFMPSFLGGK